MKATNDKKVAELTWEKLSFKDKVTLLEKELSDLRKQKEHYLEEIS